MPHSLIVCLYPKQTQGRSPCAGSGFDVQFAKVAFLCYRIWIGAD